MPDCSNNERNPLLVAGNLSTFSPSPSFSAERSSSVTMLSAHSTIQITERAPLLSSSSTTLGKPFYRPRPMWLVPFVITASIVRGMTVAPRVQVFTQLSCNQLYHDHSHIKSDLSFVYNPSHPTILPIDAVHPNLAGSYYLHSFNSSVPLLQNMCTSDPAVQSRAARLQAIMVTTMGVMSALTTSWWGHFSERHGRNRVLAATTLGLLVTDLAFYFVSKPNSPLTRHAQIIFIVAPFFEGLLGGWSTLQATTSAYISDCTSDGSRVQIFSRMTGAFFLGLAVGPTIGAFLMHHPIFSSHNSHSRPSMNSVFEVAVLLSSINLVLLFIYPESLNSKRTLETATSEDNNKPSKGLIANLLTPIATFLPKTKTLPDGRKRQDWTFSFLAIGLSLALFSMGVYQVKYLYAEHVYHWGAEELSYYISFVGALRAAYLLVIMPFIIQTFKPKDTSAPANGPRPSPTSAQIFREIKFDIILVRVSLMLDLLSHVLVVLSPQGSSELLFVAFSSLPSFGSGSIPAASSLALSMMKLNGDTGSGKLLGAFGTLQAVNQMVLGPLAFGTIYSMTVATYPKTIFAVAASACILSLIFVFLIRPKADVKGKRKNGTTVDLERGRSRVSKDLRSGLEHVPANA